MRTLILAAVLAVTGLVSTAQAQHTLPNGLFYFVGTELEILQLRAAMTKAAHWGGEVLYTNPASWSAPYTQPESMVFTYPPFAELMALGCWQTPSPDEIYLTDSWGTSEAIDGVEVEIPLVSELIEGNDPALPTACKERAIASWCWFNGPEDAVWMCPDPV